MAARRARPVEVNAATLAAAALAYLNRTDASRARLARHLTTWAERKGEPGAGALARPLIDELLQRYQASGLIDDDRLAANAVRGLRARGGSRRAIAFKLKARGIPATAITTALAAEGNESGDPDLLAALAFARKRRLGQHRPEAERAQNRRRDLAALARAGFDFDTAARALGGISGEDDDF